jgi:hypothetical protein
MTHTHDPDRNVTMPAAPTDVFDWLSGEGFVMEVANPFSIKSVTFSMPPADPMPSIADEVRGLEGLLRVKPQVG